MMGQHTSDAMRLMHHILGGQSDDAKLTDYINQLILIAQGGDKQAQWYLGSLLRQTTPKHEITQRIATQLFNNHRKRVDIEYEEVHIRMAQLKKDIQDAQKRLDELRVIQQVGEINQKWESRQSLDAYQAQVENLQTEIIALKQQVQALAQQIIMGER